MPSWTPPPPSICSCTPALAPELRAQPAWLFDQLPQRATLPADAVISGQRDRLPPVAMRLVAPISTAAAICTGAMAYTWLDSAFQTAAYDTDTRLGSVAAVVGIHSGHTLRLHAGERR